MKLALPLLLLSLLLPCFSETLVSSDGREIEVNLVKKSETHVWFTMSNGPKKFAYEISSLSPESQQRVKDWTPPSSSKFEIDFASRKTNRQVKNGFDDRMYTMLPEITIRNADQASASEELTAHLFLIGKSIVERGNLCVLHSAEFKVKALGPLKETSVESPKELSFRYDDDDNGHVFGAKYKGYLIFLVDKDGREVLLKTIPTSGYEATFQSLKKAEVGAVYDPSFEKKSGRLLQLR